MTHERIYRKVFNHYKPQPEVMVWEVDRETGLQLVPVDVVSVKPDYSIPDQYYCECDGAYTEWIWMAEHIEAMDAAEKDSANLEDLW